MRLKGWVGWMTGRSRGGRTTDDVAMDAIVVGILPRGEELPSASVRPSFQHLPTT